MALRGRNQDRTDGAGGSRNPSALPISSEPAELPSGREKSTSEPRSYTLKAWDCDKGESPSPASQSSKVRNLPAWVDPACYPQQGKITVTHHKRGSVLGWPSPVKVARSRPAEVERASTEQSVKSRLRAAYNLGNAECSWVAMLTLTYRVPPADYDRVREDRERFLDRMRKRFGPTQVGWILEFQRRGAAHFHIWIGDDCELGRRLASEPTRERTRKGVTRRVCSGESSEWIASAWVDIVGDSDPRFLRFQSGGIVELMDNADGAGRYAAKEAAKRVQKSAPWPVSQWWGMSRSLLPKSRHQTAITVADFRKRFPDMPALSRLWARLEIDD